MVVCVTVSFCGERGGEGLSKLITEGLAGYPELETEEGPGVEVILDWLLLEDTLVVSAKESLTVNTNSSKYIWRRTLKQFGAPHILK